MNARGRGGRIGSVQTGDNGGRSIGVQHSVHGRVGEVVGRAEAASGSIFAEEHNRNRLFDHRLVDDGLRIVASGVVKTFTADVRNLPSLQVLDGVLCCEEEGAGGVDGLLGRHYGFPSWIDGRRCDLTVIWS